jgi:anti-anti-sigma factor
MSSLEIVGPPDTFEVMVRPDRARVIVEPVGELDAATVGRVSSELDALVEVGFTELVLDLRKLTFMDAAGLRLVLAQLRRRDVTVRVVNGPPVVARMFDLAELAELSEPLAFVDPHEPALRRL